MIAALFCRAVPRCRSRQFSETFSFPPTNHFAYGSCQSSTFSHFLFQLRSEASRAQNLSGFLIDSSHSVRYCAMLEMRAFLEKSFAGLKTRFSIRWDSMLLLIGAVGKREGSSYQRCPRRTNQTCPRRRE